MIDRLRNFDDLAVEPVSTRTFKVLSMRSSSALVCPFCIACFPMTITTFVHLAGELVSKRMMKDPTMYSSFPQAAKKIISQQGVKGLYR